jgi:hypothetical protein
MCKSLDHEVLQFIDEWSVRFTDGSLGKAFGPAKAVHMALHLFALNGLPLTHDEINRLSMMEEAELVPELVARMPESFSRNFTSISLQLQMMVSSTARVRKASENGDVDTLAKLCDDTESGSIRNAILTKATMNAASECRNLRRSTDTWVRNTEERLQRLASASDKAEKARSQLALIEGQIEAFHSSVKDKCGHFLMNFASQQAPGMVMKFVLAGWKSAHIKMKSEKVFRDKFDAEIAAAENALMEYKQKKIETIRGVLGTNYTAECKGLMGTVVMLWHEAVQEEKSERETAKNMAVLESKLRSTSQAQMEAAKKVLTKISGNTESGLLGMAVGAWITAVADIKMDREVEKALQDVEDKMKAFMEKNKNNASSVLDRMNGASESGLIEQYFSEWKAVYTEEKSTREVANHQKAAMEKFKHLKARQSGLASCAQGRVNDLMNALLVMKTMGIWIEESRVSQVERYYQGKVNSKRKQLTGVQSIFTTFAKQLESGLAGIERDDEDAKSVSHQAPRYSDKHGDVSKHGTHRSSRHSDVSSPPKRKGMHKNGNTVSLPDIHGRQH